MTKPIYGYEEWTVATTAFPHAKVQRTMDLLAITGRVKAYGTKIIYKEPAEEEWDGTRWEKLEMAASKKEDARL